MTNSIQTTRSAQIPVALKLRYNKARTLLCFSGQNEGPIEGKDQQCSDHGNTGASGAQGKEDGTGDEARGSLQYHLGVWQNRWLSKKKGISHKRPSSHSANIWQTHRSHKASGVSPAQRSEQPHQRAIRAHTQTPAEQGRMRRVPRRATQWARTWTQAKGTWWEMCIGVELTSEWKKPNLKTMYQCSVYRLWGASQFSLKITFNNLESRMFSEKLHWPKFNSLRCTLSI